MAFDLCQDLLMLGTAGPSRPFGALLDLLANLLLVDGDLGGE